MNVIKKNAKLAGTLKDKYGVDAIAPFSARGDYLLVEFLRQLYKDLKKDLNK